MNFYGKLLEKNLYPKDSLGFQNKCNFLLGL